MAFNKCKYCTTRNAKFESYYNFQTRKDDFTVHCCTCNNETEKYSTREEAFTAWNLENPEEEK